MFEHEGDGWSHIAWSGSSYKTTVFIHRHWHLEWQMNYLLNIKTMCWIYVYVCIHIYIYIFGSVWRTSNREVNPESPTVRDMFTEWKPQSKQLPNDTLAVVPVTTETTAELSTVAPAACELACTESQSVIHAVEPILKNYEKMQYDLNLLMCLDINCSISHQRMQCHCHWLLQLQTIIVIPIKKIDVSLWYIGHTGNNRHNRTIKTRLKRSYCLSTC